MNTLLLGAIILITIAQWNQYTKQFVKELLMSSRAVNNIIYILIDVLHKCFGMHMHPYQYTCFQDDGDSNFNHLYNAAPTGIMTHILRYIN